jgi:polyhydroxybutyrate depolymerase
MEPGRRLASCFSIAAGYKRRSSTASSLLLLKALFPNLKNINTPFTAAPTRHADDVGFVQAILDVMPTMIGIDTNRIYSTGFSNGAGLTFRLAVEMGDKLAAIAPVAALPYLKYGAPPRPIPTSYFIGSVDPLLPWNGGTVVSPWTNQSSVRPPVLEQLKQWVMLSGMQPIEKPLEGTDGEERMQIGSAVNSLMIYSKSEGLGHHWPGGRDVGVPEEVLGPRIPAIDATGQIWDFFAQYQLPR